MNTLTCIKKFGKKELKNKKMQTEKPLVSIVTITFNLLKGNRKKTFIQCLDSVHNQTYQNIEHIIVDGASNDGTVDLIKKYAQKGWIRYVSEKDKGIYDAMNKGARMAKGKYVAFLNSDDFYNDSSGVEFSVCALEREKAAFSYAPVINLDESGNKEVIKPKISNVFFTIIPCHQTIFLKKDIMAKEGFFDDSFKCVGDYDLTVRLCLKKYKSVFVDKAFSTYRLGGFSLDATNDGTVFKEVADIYYKHYNRLCSLTREECEKICNDIYSPNLKDVPLRLAEKFKELDPYFDFDQYTKERKKISSGNQTIALSDWHPKMKFNPVSKIPLEERIISVVTPSYNQGDFIEETIRSVLSQEGDFYIDYIIMDGGSSDKSLEIIKKYEDKLKSNCAIKEIEGHSFYVSSNKEFKFNKCLGVSYRYVSEKDNGHGNALNKGFKMSFGEIMAWQNSDDKYHQDAFAKVVEVFTGFKEVEWLVGKNTWWDKEGNLKEEKVVLKNFYDFIFGNYAWVQQESTFWKRSLWEKSGGEINEEVKFMIDGDLWSRFFKQAKLYHLDQKLSGYREHDDNRAKLNKDWVIEEMEHFSSRMREGLPSTSYSLITKSTEGWESQELPYFENNFKLSLEERNLKYNNKEKNRFVSELQSKVKFAIFSPNKFVSKYFLSGGLRQPLRKIWYAIRFKKVEDKK